MRPDMAAVCMAPADVQSADGGADIIAVTTRNPDPAGIGIDEIVYSPLCPMMVSGLPSVGTPG